MAKQDFGKVLKTSAVNSLPWLIIALVAGAVYAMTLGVFIDPMLITVPYAPAIVGGLIVVFFTWLAWLGLDVQTALRKRVGGI